MYWGPEEQWDVDKWNQRPKLGGNEKNVFHEKKWSKKKQMKMKANGVQVYGGRLDLW